MKPDSDNVIVKSNECAEAISAVKHTYVKQMSQKLNYPLTAPKTYWKIKHGFLSNKKIPAIPTLLVPGEIIFSLNAALFSSLCWKI